jgi:hypothetical protein
MQASPPTFHAALQACSTIQAAQAPARACHAPQPRLFGSTCRALRSYAQAGLPHYVCYSECRAGIVFHQAAQHTTAKSKPWSQLLRHMSLCAMRRSCQGSSSSDATTPMCVSMPMRACLLRRGAAAAAHPRAAALPLLPPRHRPASTSVFQASMVHIYVSSKHGNTIRARCPMIQLV